MPIRGAEDRTEADRARRKAGEDHDQQADREEQFGTLGPRCLREQMRQEETPRNEHRDDYQRTLPRHCEQIAQTVCSAEAGKQEQ